MMDDSQDPEKAHLAKLYKWAEADAAFLQRLISRKEMMENPSSSSSFFTPSTPVCQENASQIRYHARQRYLRSYPFRVDEQKETLFERAKKWLKSKSRGKQTRNRRKDSHTRIFKFIFCWIVNKVDVHDESDDGSATPPASPDLWIYGKKYT